MTIRSSVRDSLWTVAGKSGVASLAGRVLHSAKTLRILMYHDVPEHLFPIFQSHLNWLTERFEIIGPNDFPSGTGTSGRPKALLTFDDGCIDNYEIVAPLLESRGMRGLFFVCPGFAEISRKAAFGLMERSSILLGEKTRDSRWQRMSRQQIIDLNKRGHGIGNHTMSHVPLTKIDANEVQREIRDSAATLESWLGHSSPFFAWTYSWSEISASALRIGKDCHPYCFSPCSGLNTWPTSSALLWRTGVDVSKPVSQLKTQLSGIVDRMCRHQRQKLSSIWESVAAVRNGKESEDFVPVVRSVSQ